MPQTGTAKATQPDGRQLLDGLPSLAVPPIDSMALVETLVEPDQGMAPEEVGPVKKLLNSFLDISIFDIGKAILFMAFVYVSGLIWVELLG